MPNQFTTLGPISKIRPVDQSKHISSETSLQSRQNPSQYHLNTGGTQSCIDVDRQHRCPQLRDQHNSEHSYMPVQLDMETKPLLTNPD